MTVPLFRYDPPIIERYPSVVGGALHGTGVVGGPPSPALTAAFADEQAAVLARLGDTPLSEVPSLAAWRRAFRAFGVDPTGYRSAAEALLRRLTKQGSIPSIDTLVDLGNLVSIRYALPVAVFDVASIDGGLTVRFATGDEVFSDLGSGTTEAPAPGEVVFVDGAGHVAARRWCWRQSTASAAGPGTNEVLVTVEGHHDGARADIDAAVSDLADLLRTYAGAGGIDSGVVDGAQPSFEGSPTGA
jgi:DNA/RNA-binding domain of Phe-tRNA-synthetase-like protein